MLFCEAQSQELKFGVLNRALALFLKHSVIERSTIFLYLIVSNTGSELHTSLGRISR